MPLPTAERWRRGAISAFCVFHLLALTWWHVGEVEYVPEAQRRPGDAWRRARAMVASVDPTGVLRSMFTQYVRMSGLWQVFIMFGPNAPHQVGVIEIVASEGIDASGAPRIDPVPIWSTQQQDVLDYTQAIGLPCGWPDAQDERWRHLRRAYAHFRVEEAERARGRRYDHIYFMCYLQALRMPDGSVDGPEWTKHAYYDGPVVRDWYVP